MKKAFNTSIDTEILEQFKEKCKEEKLPINIVLERFMQGYVSGNFKMENKICTEQFCGVDIFNWKEWDIMDTDNFYFYNVEFLLPSMQKYNGMDVGRWFDGKMEIYKDSDPDADESTSEVVWSGYVTDIHEVMEALNREV